MKPSATNTERIKQLIFILLLCCIAFVSFIEAPKYFARIKKRMLDNTAMLTMHKNVRSEVIVNGNVLFIGNSVSTWIFPPTDFNCYFFVKQNKINRANDTVFNMSLIAPKNIEQVNTDARSRFDSFVYWENEDFTRFLVSRYKLSSFEQLKTINTAQAINDYITAKQAQYVLTDEANMKFFPNATVVKEFDAGYKKDSCFSYTLFSTIYLLKIN